MGGTISLTAATENATAASTYVGVWGAPGSSGCRYVIKNGDGRFYEQAKIESADWAGDRVVGTLYGGRDRYTSNRGPDAMTYVNFAAGTSSSDPQIHFNIDNSSGEIVVNTEDGASWNYHIFTAGSDTSMSKGSAADSGDEIHRVVDNHHVTGSIWGGYSDSFNYGRYISHIWVEQRNGGVEAQVSWY